MMQDLRGQTMGGTSKRSNTTKIALHHSATETGNVFIFEQHWRSLGWRTGGYHEIILRDGTVQRCYDHNVVTNGVRGHNSTTYHICYVGNGNPTTEQRKAFIDRLAYNVERFNLKVSDILGHREFSGASTVCPGIDMNIVREEVEVHMKGRKAMSDDLYMPPRTMANATSTVLRRFSDKDVHGDKAIDGSWRVKFIDGEMTQNEAIGLLYVALERGLIQGEEGR